MSKMDRILNSKNDKESIYEIYRACRLCGGGAGYKMPIIQNIIDLDEADVELKLKIRECVQIEVHQDDKMPPLICELCVDKVNDFYEFLEMCRQTNKKTRIRLGLPPQSLPRGAPDAGDCILGLTEPLFVNEDSDGEPLSKHKKQPKIVIKKEPVVRLKVENLQEERASRQKKRQREITPPRVTRQGVKSKDDDVTLSTLKLKDKTKEKSSKAGPQSSRVATTPKSILKKDNINKSNSSEDTSLNRLKRSRDKEVAKLETPSKKVKVTIKPVPKSSPKTPPRTPPKTRITPKTDSNSDSKQIKNKQTTPPVVSTQKKLQSNSQKDKLQSNSQKDKLQLNSQKDKFSCEVCGHQLKTSQALISHMKSHNALFTNSKMACNPCGDWFVSSDEVSLHHRRHKYKNIPYNCRRCDTDFKRLDEFDDHIKDNDCVPFNEVPDVKCEVCWHMFPTNNLYEDHKCLGKDNRPGGDCFKCKKSFVFLKTLKKHQAACTGKKKEKLNISKKILDKLKPMQVRIQRCDSLLPDDNSKYCDVSCVSMYYGLDPNYYYPYISGLKIKSEFPGMVDIQDEIHNQFLAEDYVHWDSEESGTDDEITCNDTLNPTIKKREIDTLTALTLKTIFSPRLLGKVPRKKRKVKHDKVFDSLMADEDEVRMDISNIINNLGDDYDVDNDFSKVNDSSSVNDSEKIVNFKEDSDKNEYNDATSIESVDLLKDIGNHFNDSAGDVVNENNVNDSSSICNENNKSESLQNENNDSGSVNVNNENESESTNLTDSINKNEDDSKLESISNNINSKFKDNDSIESKTMNNIQKDSNNESNNLNSEENESKESNIDKDFGCTINDKIISNDKLDDLLSSNAGSKVGLGINDFSFDC